MPPALQVTVEAKLPVPVTLAEHCEAPVVTAEVGVQVAVTAVMVGAMRVREAEPDLVVSWVDVAVIVTGLVAGATVGAVYRPAELMVPSVELPPATPPTLQVTVKAKLPVPVTLAEHCEVPPVLTEVGVQEAVTAVMVLGVLFEPPLLLEVPPLQPTSREKAESARRAKGNRAGEKRNEGMSYTNMRRAFRLEAQGIPTRVPPLLYLGKTDS
jgi:hypothetical protein